MKVWELLPIFFKQKGLSLPTCRFAKLVGLQNLLISKTNYYFSWIDALVVKVRVQVNLPGRSQDLFLLLCVTLIYPYPCLSFCLTHSCLSVCLPVSVLHTQTHTHTHTHTESFLKKNVRWPRSWAKDMTKLGCGSDGLSRRKEDNLLLWMSSLDSFCL